MRQRFVDTGTAAMLQTCSMKLHEVACWCGLMTHICAGAEWPQVLHAIPNKEFGLPPRRTYDPCHGQARSHTSLTLSASTLLLWGPALHHQAAFAMAHIHGMRDLLEQHLAADLLPGGVEPAAAPAQAAPVTCLLDTDTIGVVLTTLNRAGLVTAPVLDHTKVGDSPQRTYVVDTANMVGSIDMTIILQAFLRGMFFSSSKIS